MRPVWQAVSISSLLAGRQETIASSGFSLFDKELLDSSLGEQCINGLTAQINCHFLVKGFTELKYRGSLGPPNVTDAVCTNDCNNSLRTWFNTVSSACPTTTLASKSPIRLGGNMWAGWNETCVRDPKPKQYCNDIIANFTVVPNIESMPQTELCSTCFGRRLALMQSSPFSTYDTFYASQLAYVYSKCGGSIAGHNSVSAAALYMANQALVRDCASIAPGISICLPAKCKI